MSEKFDEKEAKWVWNNASFDTGVEELANRKRECMIRRVYNIVGCNGKLEKEQEINNC